jgi:hypothetical protein
MPKSPLWENAEFLADCASPMMKKDIRQKYGCSSGLVVDVRRHLGATKDEARSREPGETDEITDNGDGTKTFGFIRHRPVTLEDARDLIRSTGDNPDAYNISIRAIAYGDGKSSNRISAWPKSGVALAETYALSHMYAEAAKHEKPRPAGSGSSGRGTVVVLADWQIGKTGRRGGTPELLDRLARARDKVRQELEQRQPDEILILDGGDGIEGFESGGNPMFTNDLSLPDQLDCYATEMFKFVRLASEFTGDSGVTVGAVPSNHAAWRRGKQNLGNPSEDFGLFTQRQVHKVATAAGISVELHVPDEWDESLCVDFMGTPIGLVHGNQFAPGKAIDWWQGQAFGNQAITRADVLVTAHYHSWGAGVAGQNPFTQRERHWVAAPTLDSGSDWYRNIKGRDSLPGTLIFDVTEDGFDLGSLKIL